MSTLTISLRDSVRLRLENLAQEYGVLLDDFIASTLSQRAAVADADSYVQRRARLGSPQHLASLLAKAPYTPPLPGDTIQ